MQSHHHWLAGLTLLSNVAAMLAFTAFLAPVTGVYRFEVSAPRWDVCAHDPRDGGRATHLAMVWAKL